MGELETYFSEELKRLGYGKRLHILVSTSGGLDVNSAIRSHGKGGAQGLLTGLATNGDSDDLSDDLLLFKSNGLLFNSFILEKDDKVSSVILFDAHIKLPYQWRFHKKD